MIFGVRLRGAGLVSAQQKQVDDPKHPGHMSIIEGDLRRSEKIEGVARVGW